MSLEFTYIYSFVFHIIISIIIICIIIIIVIIIIIIIIIIIFHDQSFVEIEQEVFSTVIPSLPLIQEGQLSVSGKRMCTS